MLRARARAESARDERGSCGGECEDDVRERREHLFQPQLFYLVSPPKRLSENNHRGWKYRKKKQKEEQKSTLNGKSIGCLSMKQRHPQVHWNCRNGFLFQIGRIYVHGIISSNNSRWWYRLSDSSLQMPPSSTHPLDEFNANNPPAGITTVKKNDIQVNLSHRPFKCPEITAVVG